MNWLDSMLVDPVVSSLGPLMTQRLVPRLTAAVTGLLERAQELTAALPRGGFQGASPALFQTSEASSDRGSAATTALPLVVPFSRNRSDHGLIESINTEFHAG